MALFTNIAMSQSTEKKTVLDKITSIDKNIVKLFPRWSVCERSLQIEIFHAFQLLGYDENTLDKNNIIVMSAPIEDGKIEILAVTCGKQTLTSIDNNRLGKLKSRLEEREEYCYKLLPPDESLTQDETKAIVDYFEPSNPAIKQAISLSLFEQNIRLGTSGIWLKSKIGNDPLGYPFWQSGETRVLLKRPLDISDNSTFPFPLSFHLGISFRMGAGVDDDNSALSWVSERVLNTGPDGKGVGGFEFHLPQHPNLGLKFNIELPFGDIHGRGINPNTYGLLPADNSVFFKPESEYQGNISNIAPILRSSGQVGVFYHWWLNKDKAENYFRFTAGVNYFEVDEYGVFINENEYGNEYNLVRNNVEGLKTYYPEDGDWIFLRADYRNSSGFPFGLGLQYSNQILLGHLYVPIIHPWFYFEFKYATPLRHVRPFEQKNFFMISPTIRLTI